MVTKKEKQLATLLLKERLERLTGKKVILKEKYEESLRRYISLGLRTITKPGVLRSDYSKALSILVQWYINENAEPIELRELVEDGSMGLDILEQLDAASDINEINIMKTVIDPEYFGGDEDED